MRPKQIRLLSTNELLIKWKDEEETLISLMKLRKYCPCATCAAAREENSKSYIPLFSGDQLKVDKIVQVGSYAISIHWKDGHNTGIFEHAYLKYLAEI